MSKNSLPSPETLRQLLRYEPETGKLFWRERPVEMFTAESRWKWWNGRFAGEEALASLRKSGYLGGNIFNRIHITHRVIWAMETGAWPVEQLDHVDHDRTNNRMENLREVSSKENGRNQSVPRNNTSGVVGVHWHKRDKIWVAQIRAGGRIIHLGYFDDISSATAARADANVKYGYHENHGGDT